MEPRKMVQMNRFAGQKLRHRCTEQTYGHQGGKAVGNGGECLMGTVSILQDEKVLEDDGGQVCTTV